MKQKFGDNSCVWSCGGEVRVLGCLETLLLFFMFWEVSKVPVTGGTGHLKNHLFHVILGSVLSWSWFWARALGWVISRSAFQPQLSCASVVLISVFVVRVVLTSLHLVISHWTGINTLFPGTGSSAGTGWFSLPTWRSVRCLTLFVLSVAKYFLENHNFLLLQWFYPSAGWKSPERLSLTIATSGESPCL